MDVTTFLCCGGLHRTVTVENTENWTGPVKTITHYVSRYEGCAHWKTKAFALQHSNLYGTLLIWEQYPGAPQEYDHCFRGKWGLDVTDY